MKKTKVLKKKHKIIKPYNNKAAFIEIVGKKIGNLVWDLWDGDFNILIWLAAKDGGKSYVAINYAIVQMEMNDNFNTLIAMFLKGEAKEKIVNEVEKAIDNIIANGFTLKYPYKKSWFTFFRMKYTEQENKHTNQKIRSMSYDDQDALSSKPLPKQSYYYGLMHIEEAIPRNVMVDIDPKTYWRDYEIQMNNIERGYRDAIIANQGTKLTPQKTIITGNAWYEHPLVLAMEKAIPFNTFAKYIFGFRKDEILEMFLGKENQDRLNERWGSFQVSLLKHTFLAKQDIQEGRKILFLRSTKFLNPRNQTTRRADEHLSKIYWTLVNNDQEKLVMHLGIGNSETEKTLVYNTDYQIKAFVTLENYQSILGTFYSFSVGWDIDASSRLVGTATAFFVKTIKGPWGNDLEIPSIVILAQDFIESHITRGSYVFGARGRQISKIAKITNDFYDTFKVSQFVPKERVYFTVDDDQEWALNGLYPLISHNYGDLRKAVKQQITKINRYSKKSYVDLYSAYGYNDREAWIRTLFEYKMIHFMPDTMTLLTYYKGQPKLKSGTHGLYTGAWKKASDFLTSSQYAIYPFLGWTIPTINNWIEDNTIAFYTKIDREIYDINIKNKLASLQNQERSNNERYIEG